MRTGEFPFYGEGWTTCSEKTFDWKKEKPRSERVAAGVFFRPEISGCREYVLVAGLFGEIGFPFRAHGHFFEKF